MSESPPHQQNIETVTCQNLNDAIAHYTNDLGYRLDMLKPADNPREALLSVPPAITDGGLTPESAQQPRDFVRLMLPKDNLQPPAVAGGSDWVTGRAGMEYRDLIRDRLDGKVIGSHIRLTKEGDVADYVHYHKVEFQMIRCIKGRIKVVYEDQGGPFWLEPGDWVIQPPEIRHRVLYAEAGSEVIEISMPAEHETWVDHEMQLPNDVIKPDRDFNGQRFVRFIAPKS